MQAIESERAFWAVTSWGWRKLLVAMEGVHDIRFLKHAAGIFHKADSSFPDLDRLESSGQLMFLPLGGGAAWTWVHRFAGLACSECHIYDRETMPLTLERENAARLVNERPGCRAFVTQKRGIENYFHPAAIAESLGIKIDFGDAIDVSMAAAKQFFDKSGCDAGWRQLSSDARKRQRDRAKKMIHTHALPHMTARRLDAQDNAGEIRQWLMAIQAQVSTLSSSPRFICSNAHF